MHLAIYTDLLHLHVEVHISPETGFRALLKINLNTSFRLGTGGKGGGGGLNGQGEGERKGKKLHIDPQAERSTWIPNQKSIHLLLPL